VVARLGELVGNFPLPFGERVRVRGDTGPTGLRSGRRGRTPSELIHKDNNTLVEGVTANKVSAIRGNEGFPLLSTG